MTQQAQNVTLHINGSRRSLALDIGESLNHLLREKLGLVGTKRGCETGGCGSCTVLLDGKAVYSCMLYAVQAVGKQITTIEGLQNGPHLDKIQESFMDNGGLQCGYCTPGFIMSAKGLLDSVSDPSDEEIREALAGNLCRCTGYTKIFDSIRAAAKSQRKE